MQKKTITVGNLSAVIRNRTRRIPILEAEIKAALIRFHPEIAAYEKAQFSVVTPHLPYDQNGRLIEQRTPEQEDALRAFTQATMLVTTENPLGEAYATAAREFVPLMARIVSVSGYEDIALENLFEIWLDEADAAFWQAIADAIADMDKPLTSPIEQPTKTLSEDEKRLPLSVLSAENGVTALKNASTR